MQTDKIQFDDIRYNPERGAFEALVRLHDGGEVFSYPTHVHAPLHAEYEIIARGLTLAARDMHHRKSPTLRSHRIAAPIQLAPVSTQQKSLMHRFFGNLAA